MKNKKLIIFGIIGLIIIGLFISSYFILRSPWKFREDRPIKILWINSYDANSFWSIDEINGFKDSLDQGGIKYEIKAMHLNSFLSKDEELIIQVAEDTKKLIDSWKPDLVYATDDGAQQYVSSSYINADLPWIFAGLNLEEKDYGFDNAKNIVGIFERKPILDVLNSAKAIYPSAKKITVIGNDGLTGIAIQDEARPIIEDFEGFEIVNWFGKVTTYSEWKDAVLEGNKNSDIILFLWVGILWDGSEEVPLEEMAKWYINNSHIPSFSVWKQAVEAGFLLSIQRFPYSQGYEAGKLAKQILVEGETPGEIDSYAPIQSSRFINLARAKTFGLEIPSSILINSEVIEKFPWEEGQ